MRPIHSFIPRIRGEWMQEVPSTLLSSLTLCGWKEDNVCPAWFLFFVFASERQLRRKMGELLQRFGGLSKIAEVGFAHSLVHTEVLKPLIHDYMLSSKVLEAVTEEKWLVQHRAPRRSSTFSHTPKTLGSLLLLADSALERGEGTGGDGHRMNAQESSGLRSEPMPTVWVPIDHAEGPVLTLILLCPERVFSLALGHQNRQFQSSVVSTTQVGQAPGRLMQDLAQQSAAQYQLLSCSGELETPKLSRVQLQIPLLDVCPPGPYRSFEHSRNCEGLAILRFATE
ncbi:Neurofibromin [Manis javanica]|nr:Neurofibromin [Manis javanica]